MWTMTCSGGNRGSRGRSAQRNLSTIPISEKTTIAGLAGRLAELHVEMGRYDAAEPLYRRALAVTAKERAAATRDEQRQGADYNAATLSVGLATIYRHQGRFAEAITLAGILEKGTCSGGSKTPRRNATFSTRARAWSTIFSETNPFLTAPGMASRYSSSS